MIRNSAIGRAYQLVMTENVNDLRHLRLILVHGTFARGAAWAAEGSAFREKLKNLLAAKGFDAEFEIFEWSGQNGDRARFSAAAELASVLSANYTSWGSQKTCLLISHSHGGNVSLLAHKHLKPTEHVDGIITLGTPFIFVGKSLVAKSSEWHFIRNLILFFLAVPALMLGFAVTQVTAVVGFIASMALSFVLAVMFFSYLESGSWKLWRAITGERAAVGLMKNYRPPVIKGTRILSIFYRSDEARKYLRALSLGVPVLDWVLTRMASIVVTTVGFGLIVIYSLKFLIPFDLQVINSLNGWLAKYVWSLPWQAIFVAIATSMALIIVVRATSSLLKSNPTGFGWSNPLANLLLRMGVDYVPQGHGFKSKELSMLEWAEGDERTLIHSQYFSDDRVCLRIAEWIGEHWAS